MPLRSKVDHPTFSSEKELEGRETMLNLLQRSPIPADQILSNAGLYLESKHLSRILCMDFLYRQIVHVHGSVFEFGTRWGQNAALFSALRGIYEPFNRHRKIVAFDTFDGFRSIAKEDGNAELMKVGQLSTTPGYADYLENILTTHEDLNPLSHIKKHEICVGDAVKELPEYLKRSNETIVALAYFDFDIYEPTLKCLEIIRPRLTKGSVVAFDELNDPDAPGETQAVMEVFGLNNVRLQRFRYASRISYFIVE